MNSKNGNHAVDFTAIKYIMVTDFDDHWEAKTGKETSFSRGLIEPLVFRLGLPKETIPTLFIKKQADKVIGSWIGKCSGFKWGKSKNGLKTIRFSVSQLEPIALPKEFRKYKIGWHVHKNHAFANEHLLPVFLKEMRDTDDWRLFELYSHYLFKLIGINTIHPFPTERNKGKADGEFIVNDLYVLYDATVNDGFMETKEEQIERYVSKMRGKRTVTIGKQQYPLQGIEKQIWIITRGEESARIPSNTNTSVVIKEIPFHKLEAIFYARMHEEISETELCKLLKSL